MYGFGLDAPATVPPLPSRYSGDELDGQLYVAGIVATPEAFETICVCSKYGSVPLPAVPAAYRSSDVPETGLVPACTVTWNDEPANVVAAAPVPVRLTVCVPAGALLITVSVPLRVPVAVGVKVTKIWQLARPARLAAHPLLVWLKSPVIAMLDRLSGAEPRLVAVTIHGALDIPVVIVPNIPAVAESERIGIAGVAVPLSATLCGLPAALLVKVRVPERVPVAVGLKITRIWQVELAVRLPTQPKLCCEKSPVVAIFEIVTVTVPLFVTVNVCAELASPVIVLANVSVVAESVNCPLVPPPPPPCTTTPEPHPTAATSAAVNKTLAAVTTARRRNTGLTKR